MDDCYIIATGIKRNKLSKTKVIEMYKSRQRERKDFRILKTVRLEVRQINHQDADRDLFVRFCAVCIVSY